MSIDEWDQREVCSDGACVGVIGPDGLCKVCGRVAQNWGDERKRGLVEPSTTTAAEVDDELYDDEPDDTDDEDQDAEDDAEDVAHDEDATSDARHAEADDDVAGYEWGRRKLCSDGACVGVIGATGKCTVCGSAP